MKLDVLTVAAHPDDGELGTAGTLLALKARGYKVGILDLTEGEPTIRGSIETRRREAAAATEVLKLDFRHNLELPTHYLLETVEARIKVAEVLRETHPEVVLAHYPEDAHPDHVSASRITEAARFYAKRPTAPTWKGSPRYPPRLYFFHEAHKRLHLPISFLVDISAHYETKLKAIACYGSQGNLDTDPDAVRTWMGTEPRARYYGNLAGSEYAEAFYSPEPIVINNFDGSFFP
jgi:bacillithiol biosynthesis deacetylase BshB1